VSPAVNNLVRELGDAVDAKALGSLELFRKASVTAEPTPASCGGEESKPTLRLGTF
jgi:hypothetical protein